jgi:cell filamentation protein
MAGRTRDERVALSDGTVATMPTMRKTEGKLFTVGPAIPVALDAIGDKLRARNYLHGLRREEFAKQAADIMAEINTVHPFREGNGRTQRVFMEQLAHTAGHDLDFTVISKERMIQASIAAHERNDTSMMRRMFDEISDPERVTLLQNSIAALESKIDWNNRYVATIAPGHSVELVFAGISGNQFMARTKTDILFGWVSDLPTPRPQPNQTFTLTVPSRRGRLQQKSPYRS